MSNLEAVKAGDRRRTLEELAATLAAHLDAADGSVAAQIAGQYRQVLKDLADLPPETVVKPKKDELRERRQARSRSATAKAGAAAGKQKPVVGA
jgi:hypothetical protein